MSTTTQNIQTIRFNAGHMNAVKDALMAQIPNLVVNEKAEKNEYVLFALKCKAKDTPTITCTAYDGRKGGKLVLFNAPAFDLPAVPEEEPPFETENA